MKKYEGLWKQKNKNETYSGRYIEKSSLPDKFKVTIYHNRNAGGKNPEYLMKFTEYKKKDDTLKAADDELKHKRGRHRIKIELKASEIKKMYDSGMNYNMIAKAMGCGTNVAGDYIRMLMSKGVITKRPRAHTYKM